MTTDCLAGDDPDTPRSRKTPPVWRLREAYTAALLGFLLAMSCLAARAADWPTYMHDNARSGITDEHLSPPLHEQWVFVAQHAPQPAWPKPVKELPRVLFDDACHVAVADGAVYFGSSADNKVYCLDASTGNVRWSAFTEGPVRLAPAIWRDRVLVGSDDGHAYCLAAHDGTVLWKVRAAFSDRKVLGNDRMISLWPLRTGVLVDHAEGVAYFAAGIFPAEGLFICAVNADDGTLLWRNDTCGELGPQQEFGGVTPQGYLLASESKLYVPSGRAMPAAFDRKDGRFLYYSSPGGKVGGTWALLTDEDLVAGVNLKVSYDKETGRRMGSDRYAWFPGIRLVAGPHRSYLLTYYDISAIDRKAFPAAMRERRAALDARNRSASRVQDLRKKRDRVPADERPVIDKQIDELTGDIKALDEKRRKIEDSLLKWRRPFDKPSSAILAGGVLFLGGQDRVVALEAATGKELWSGNVRGNASGLAVSDGRLFVSTDTGTIHSFGEKAVAEAHDVKPAVTPQPYPEDELTPLYTAAAESIVRATGIKNGYCLVLGCRTGRLAFELARRTDLRIIGIEPDEQKVEVARRKLDAAGLYGPRVTVDHGSLSKLPYSDYFANLIVSDEMLVSGTLRGSSSETFRVLRPYGGVALFNQPAETEGAGRPPGLDPSSIGRPRDRRGPFMRQPIDTGAETEVIRDGGVWIKITRTRLPGAGKWTHLYADPANTACSDDRLVKCPLGVLWFGGPGPERMVERHARAAGPLSLNGRLFVQGENVVMAYDAYNGLLIWEREIPGAVRVRVDADGSNLAASNDGLFVAAGDKCFRLDPATGKTLRTYTLPPASDGAPRRWGYVACVGNVLFGSTSQPLQDYGAWWRDLVQPDGTWRPLPEDATPEMRRSYASYVARYPSPDAIAYAAFQDSGGMWHPMGRFPKWGEVRTPQGAVTPGMMTSDSIFALDTDTGELRWVHHGSRIGHPTISIRDGRVFFAEGSTSAEQREQALAEKRAHLKELTGEEADRVKREIEGADIRLVVALAAATGEKNWEKAIDLTGCGGDRLASAYRAGGRGILFFFGAFSNHDRGLFRSGTLKWRRVAALSAADGSVLWSRELGYLRRPVVMKDELIVEPWMCDIRTGEIKSRIHPVTGKDVPWEFIRGGHSCGITTASPNGFFLRSYSTTYYDLNQDRGMLPFGAIRPGCWLNIITANGLVLFPEASSGCRCSFPIRSTVVLAPREPTDENRPWSLFPRRGGQTPGDDALTPVKHLALNFGAPGERKDKDGTLWFAYPRPRLANLQVDWIMPLDLDEQILPEMGYFHRNFRGVHIQGTDKPWVFASGCRGLTRCDVPLVANGDQPASYTVRLSFAAPPGDRPGQRVFDITLQDTVVLNEFDIVREAGAPQKAVVKEFKGVPVTDTLAIQLVPRIKSPIKSEAPLINGIEIVREEP